MEPSKTNEDILFLMLNYFKKKKIETRLKEKVKKCFVIEFYFNINKSSQIQAKNIINFTRKGDIFWILEFKVALNQTFDLNDLADPTKSIYPKDWETSVKSNHKIGGLRRRISTCLIKEIFEDFMSETLTFFREKVEMNTKIS